MTSGSALPIWINPALQEYTALRAEVTTAMQTQHATLAFGSATLGLLAAGGFQLIDDPASLALVFVGAVPLISLLIVSIWLGELARMMRAGRQLHLIEQELKRSIPDAPGPVFNWEQSLQGSDKSSWLERQYQFSYHAVVVMFAVVAAASIAFAMYQVAWSSGWMIVGIAELVLVLAGAAGLLAAVVDACRYPKPSDAPFGSASTRAGAEPT